MPVESCFLYHFVVSSLFIHAVGCIKEDDDVELVEAKVMQEVRGHFRPEFLNRVDEVILFCLLVREEGEGVIEFGGEHVFLFYLDKAVEDF